MNDDNKGGGDNRDPDNVLSSAEMRRAAVAQSIAELRQWRERHRHLTELSEFFDAIDSEEEE